MRSVIVVTDPADYDGRHGHAERRCRNGHGASAARGQGVRARIHLRRAGRRRSCARGDPRFPEELAIPLRHAAAPRYGENPQQPAAAYARLSADGHAPGLLDAEPHRGRAALIQQLPGCAMRPGKPPKCSRNRPWRSSSTWCRADLPSGNPSLPPTRRRSLAIRFRPLAGSWRLNRVVDRDTAALMRKIKLDIIIAPGYDDDARAILLRKKGTRILILAKPGSIHRAHGRPGRAADRGRHAWCRRPISSPTIRVSGRS